MLPQWENSGGTPTRGMVNHANWRLFNGEPPADFQFPDLDATGKEIPVGTGPDTALFIGPKATLYSQVLDIPLPVLQTAGSGQGRIFVWGWTEYNDVFKGTPRHRTEFCNELIVTNISQAEGKVTVALHFSLYQRHNCADEDCAKRQRNP